MRTSALSGRAYLVAWAGDYDTFKAALPSLDAAVSPVTVPGLKGTFPLIIAPERRRRDRSELFMSVLEHEIVHVNQHLLGFRFPDYKGRSLSSLVNNFFSDVHLEFEAHFIQYFHWPPNLCFGKAQLALEEWVLLRAYTSAVEKVLKRAAHGQVDLNALPRFLSRVPRTAPERFKLMGCGVDLIQWFLKRWCVDVHVAKEVVISQGVDPASPALSVVQDWLKAEAPKVGWDYFAGV